MLKKLGMLVLAVFVSSVAFAQDFQFKPAVGGGSYFSEEDVTFDPSALFFAAHVDALELPFFDAATGVGAEVSWDSAESGVNYNLWSLNRADIIAGRVYGGTDMKFLQSDADGVGADFDLRLVTGLYLGKVGNGNLVAEFYTLEENRPLAFSIMYKF